MIHLVADWLELGARCLILANKGGTLATGRTVVLKSAKQTLRAAILLGELIQDVGIPSGVVNLVRVTRARPTLH